MSDENNINIIKNIEKRNEKVKISKDGNTIKFNSIKNCAIWISKNLNTTASYVRIREGITRVLDGKRKTYLGYNFSIIS